jgi:Fe-S cluster biogenesis protein NfuA
MGATQDEILRVLREVLAPLVRADGGEIYLVSVNDDAVKLHLGGRYAGCPGNNLTRRQIIEPAINAVAPKAQISVTSGALVPDGAKPVDV